ncbi:hypothetical protein DMUE_3600, partial [Dictyocoela muelleri]
VIKYRTPLNILLQAIYFLMAGTSYDQTKLFLGISKNTISMIKKRLRQIYKNHMERDKTLIGGPGIIVEVDESVICRRGIIRYPTSTDDNIKDSIWIIGGIENTPERNFFVKVIKDRRINTLSEALEGLIAMGSILYTDGHPSYPAVAENLCLEHRVVNHSEGFKSVDGIHTNNIEGFWACLKSNMRKEHGVKRDNIETWLNEYSFKRRYLKNVDSEEFFERFKEIIKYFLI